MQRPTMKSKTAANHLAERLVLEDSSVILELLSEMASSFGETGSIAQERDLLNSETIGIWRRQVEGGNLCWKKPENADPWGFWASVEKIEPKGDKQRIVLIGESVARGFLYDPRFNPASALRTVLTASSGRNDVDVIDLARLDLELHTLCQIAEASFALQPDALVILAGNNWQPFRTAQGFLSEVSKALLEGNIAAAKAAIGESLLAEVHLLLVRLAELSKANGVPILFLLPEFNLVDWKNGINAHPLLLGGNIRAEWLGLRKELEQTKDNLKQETIVELAARMAALDGATIPLAPEVLGRVNHVTGDMHTAREYFEQAKDSGLFQFAASPRCFSITQTMIRAEAEERGLFLVDLPRCFAEYLNGELPGRRIFHDYCHLTAEGVIVAMSYAAERLLPMLGRPARCAAELRAFHPPLSNRTLAEASFLAAVHNANWGQEEIVYYHCKEALRLSPDIAVTMFLFLDCCVRRTPTILCDSFSRLAAMHTKPFIKFLFDDPRSGKRLPAVLVRALISALEPTHQHLESKIQKLLNQEYCPGIDLIESGGAMSVLSIERTWRERSAYFKARDIKTRFAVVYAGGMPVQLDLSYRTPTATQDQCVEIFLGSRKVGEAPASTDWVTWSVDLSSAALQAGLNFVDIWWPVSSSQDFSCASETLERGSVEAVYPVFGELYSLKLNCGSLLLFQKEESHLPSTAKQLC
jgi:hypothetical protein